MIWLPLVLSWLFAAGCVVAMVVRDRPAVPQRADDALIEALRYQQERYLAALTAFAAEWREERHFLVHAALASQSPSASATLARAEEAPKIAVMLAAKEMQRERNEADQIALDGNGQPVTPAM